MGGEFLQSDDQRHLDRAASRIPVGIGEGCVIGNAIIDKNARIGDGCKISNARSVDEFHDPELGYYVKSGIVVIPKNAVVPDGTVI